MATNHSGVMCSQPEHHHATQCVHSQNIILQHTVCSQPEHHPTRHSVLTGRTPSYNTQCVHYQNTILRHTVCSKAEHHPTTHSVFTTRTSSYNTQCVHNQNTTLQHIVFTDRAPSGNKPQWGDVFTTKTPSYDTQCVHNQNTILQHTVCSQTEYRLATNHSGVMCSQPEHHPTIHSVFTTRTLSYNTQCVHRQSTVWQQTTVA